MHFFFILDNGLSVDKYLASCEIKNNAVASILDNHSATSATGNEKVKIKTQTWQKTKVVKYGRCLKCVEAI